MRFPTGAGAFRAIWGTVRYRRSKADDRELDSRGGAAVMYGVLDSVDGMEPEVRRVVLDLAAGWPNKGVREAVTDKLAPSAASDDSSSAPSESDH